MKKIIAATILALAALAPSVSFAKGIPLFFQTGDELFEVKNAPQFQDGYSLGFACKRFGLFYADVWTWDCKLMAINVASFSASDLDEKSLSEYSTRFSLGDRVRSAWNRFGIIGMLLLLVGLGVFKARE